MICQVITCSDETVECIVWFALSSTAMPRSSFSAYDEDCSRCRRACTEKALSEPYSAFWNLIRLRIVEFVLLPGNFRSLCLAKTESCSFRAGPRDVFLLNDTEVPEVNWLWRVHLSFPSAEAVVCTGAMKSSSSSEELQTNALVGWHVCVTEDVAPVKVNPGRSFYRSARSLSQKKSPQDPATPPETNCSRLAVLGCHPRSAPSLITMYYSQSRTPAVREPRSSFRMG